MKRLINIYDFNLFPLLWFSYKLNFLIKLYNQNIMNTPKGTSRLLYTRSQNSKAINNNSVQKIG